MIIFLVACPKSQVKHANQLRFSDLPEVADAPFMLEDESDFAWKVEDLELSIAKGIPDKQLALKLGQKQAQKIIAAVRRDDLANIERHARDFVIILQLRDKANLPGPTEQEHAALRAAEVRLAKAGRVDTTYCLQRTMAAINTPGANKELREIEQFAEDLAKAQWGEVASRAGLIDTKESALRCYIDEQFVKDLSEDMVARYVDITSQFAKTGPDVKTIRAHGSSLIQTPWRIMRAHALAGDATKAIPYLEKLPALDNVKLILGRLRIAEVANGDLKPWLAVAALLDQPNTERQDLAAVDAVLSSISVKKKKELWWTLSKVLVRRGKSRLARHYAGRTDIFESPEPDRAQYLLSLYEGEIGNLVNNERPDAAERLFKEAVALWKTAQSKYPDADIHPNIADFQATVGSGLIGIGEIDKATRLLEKSVKHAANVKAMESLGFLMMRKGSMTAAKDMLLKATKLPVKTTEDALLQLRALRHLAKVYRALKQDDQAKAALTEALFRCRGLAEKVNDYGMALIDIERGQIYTQLGMPKDAHRRFDEAMSNAPNEAGVFADIVAHYVEANQYDEARQAFHTAMASPSMDRYYQVYMALWILAQAKRNKTVPDPIAQRTLADANSSLWYDHLARLAQGKTTAKQLAKLANTKAKQAELFFYSAVFSPDGDQINYRRMAKVLKTDMYRFFEYTFALKWTK